MRIVHSVWPAVSRVREQLTGYETLNKNAIIPFSSSQPSIPEYSQFPLLHVAHPKARRPLCRLHSAHRALARSAHRPELRLEGGHINIRAQTVRTARRTRSGRLTLAAIAEAPVLMAPEVAGALLAAGRVQALHVAGGQPMVGLLWPVIETGTGHIAGFCRQMKSIAKIMMNTKS